MYGIRDLHKMSHSILMACIVKVYVVSSRVMQRNQHQKVSHSNVKFLIVKIYVIFDIKTSVYLSYCDILHSNYILNIQNFEKNSISHPYHMNVTYNVM
jgi:hypothetical protein